MGSMELSSLVSEPTTLLSLAAAEYNRYPGEVATLYMAFSVPDERGTLQLALPKVMEIDSYVLPEGIPYTLPLVMEDEQDVILSIPLEEPFHIGQEYQIEVRAALKTFHFNQYLLAEARLLDRDLQTLGLEAIRITVHAKGKYLQYLPELYEKDDFTGRFLMLFESMWKPVSQQIDQVDAYFDPGLTPETFIPWLATWIGMPVDDSLPPERMRALLKSAMMLFQCRGTYKALQTYLQIYTGGEVNVVEQRARNFVLGPQSALGVDIALGTKNRPNTVTIDIRVSSAEPERMHFSEAMYQRKIEEITRTLVPAHVDYQVHCYFDHLLEKRN
jgi:phage tail-like protein